MKPVNLKWIFFVSMICWNGFLAAQSRSKWNLSTPTQSLKVFCKALQSGDTALVKKVVNRDGYKDVVSRNLYLYAEKWQAIIAQKRVVVFHQSKRLQILKLGDEDYLLSFILGKGTWKFTSFITKP